MIVLAAVLAGCQTVTDVTETRLDVRRDVAGNLSATISNPKDTSFDKLVINPETGEVAIENYKSAANIAAVQEAGAVAQANAANQQLLTAVFMQLLQQSASQWTGGVDVPRAPPPAPPAEPSTTE